MCKICRFYTLPKGFSACRCTSFTTRARDCLRDLSDRSHPQETKGISLTLAIESAIAFVYKRSFIDNI